MTPNEIAAAIKAAIDKCSDERSREAFLDDLCDKLEDVFCLKCQRQECQCTWDTPWHDLIDDD